MTTSKFPPRFLAGTQDLPQPLSPASRCQRKKTERQKRPKKKKRTKELDKSQLLDQGLKFRFNHCHLLPGVPDLFRLLFCHVQRLLQCILYCRNLLRHCVHVELERRDLIVILSSGDGFTFIVAIFFLMASMVTRD